jgi:hypothetical protein
MATPPTRPIYRAAAAVACLIRHCAIAVLASRRDGADRGRHDHIAGLSALVVHPAATSSSVPPDPNRREPSGIRR